MTLSWEDERHALLSAVKEMAKRGLVTGTAGNASSRLTAPGEPGRFLITPAATPYETMETSDLVVVDEELEPVEEEGIPSTESLLHLGIYRARPDVQSIMHTHSVFATAAAVAGRDIPPIVDEMLVYVGGPIRVAEYGRPASQDLADHAVAALGDRKAVFLRHHGMCAVGKNPQEALEICTLAERVAQVYFYAALAGSVRTLPDDVIESEIAIYRMRSGFDD